MILNKISTLINKYPHLIIGGIVLFFMANLLSFNLSSGLYILLYIFFELLYRPSLVNSKELVRHLAETLETTADISVIILGIIFLLKYFGKILGKKTGIRG
jgi:hypothetical protein